jgi:two-component system response regulator MprA
VRNGRRIDLSAREFALLLVFMRNPNRIFDRDRLLDLVWGSDREVTPGTVDTYVSYLRAKLERGDEARLIRTVRGAGYALRSE